VTDGQSLAATQDLKITTSTTAITSATTSNGAAGAADEEEEIDEGPLYPSLSLVTAQRKRDQIVLLRSQIRGMKLGFNTQFDELFR
jgi:hypothetical protein